MIIFDPNKMRTIGEVYGSAMKCTTKEEANNFREAWIDHALATNSTHTREEWYSIFQQNIGYYCGYYDKETAAKILELFDTVHPIFGKSHLGMSDWK